MTRRTRHVVRTCLASMLVVLATLLVPHGAAALPGDINTAAGGSIGDGYSFFASIRGGSDLAYNATGDQLYVADRVDHRIRRVINNQIRTFAGNGSAVGPLGDGGLATAASLAAPDGVTVDRFGNVFIADTGHNRIRMVNTLGVISTVAGNGVAAFSGDGGPATAASLNAPRGVAVDTNGDIYIADTGNVRIRRVSGGVIDTIAGDPLIDGLHTPAEIGPAGTAWLHNPIEVALAPRTASGAFAGYYIAEERSLFPLEIQEGKVWFVNAAGNISRFAGCISFVPCGTNDGSPATLADLIAPSDVSVDSAGTVYIADRADHRIRRVKSGTISTVAGTGTGGSSAGDGGPANKARIDSPEGVAPHPDRVTFAIADTGNFKVRRVSLGDIGGLVGALGDSGLATNAWVTAPSAVSVDGLGTGYLVDAVGRLRKLKDNRPLTYILTLVGDGPMTGYADAFNAVPVDVTVDSFNIPIFSDANGNRIFRFTGSAAVEVITNAIAGPETIAAGPAAFLTAAEATNPLNARQVVYVTDAGNSIRAVSKGKAPVTFAGSAGTCGFSGDGGPAALATLCAPGGMTVDQFGTVFVADTGNNRIRRITRGPDGIANGADDVISTVFVTGAAPLDVAVAPNGTLYAVLANHTVVRWTGVLSTVAGTAGVPGFSGDGGPGTAANLSSPLSVAFDVNSGRVLIADTGNNRVRYLEP